jgi:regulator of ribonuclease activity A
MSFNTADLCDEHDGLHVAEPMFRIFGRRRAFNGPIATVKCHEDNSRVREALEEPGEGRVLVVDGGGSMRRALLGDMLGALAVRNGWAGVVVNGCIRDSDAIDALELGVRALATIPVKSIKRGDGQRDVSVSFAGVTFRPGEHLYADADGIVVAPVPMIGRE